MSTPPRRPSSLVLLVLCASSVIVSLDSTIVNVAVSPISRALGASSQQLQWVLDAYSVVFAGLLLFFGALGDRVGHKGLLLLGLVLFGTASGVASQAGDPNVLIALRAVQGVGGALIMPSSLALLQREYGGARLPFALGMWSASAGAGVGIGPLLGGALISIWSWRAVFLVNVVLVAIALSVAAPLLPKVDRRPRAFDLGGVVLLTAASLLIVAAVITSSSTGWLHEPALALVIVGAIVLVASIAWERRAPEPLLNMRWFRDHSFSVGGLVGMLLFFAMVGSSFVLMQYLQQVLGYSPLHAGLAILPIVACTIAFSPVSAALVDRVGVRWLTTAGLLVLAGGMYGLSRIGVDTGYGYIVGVGAAYGVGVGIGITPATDAVMSSVAARDPGVASGFNEMAQEVGAAVGVAVLGTVTIDAFHARLTQIAPVGADRGGSLTAALRAAAAHGAAETHAVKAAYVHGTDLGLIVAAAAALGGAIIAALLLPSRGAPEADETESLLSTPGSAKPREAARPRAS